MTSSFQLGPGLIATSIAAILLEILIPLGLGWLVARRLGVSWRYFAYGALIFGLFQMVSRIPLVQITQALIAPQLQASRPLLLAWVTLLALTAGLFEEFGRYVGYRWLMRHEPKTWDKAVMYGLGHGGIESMLLIAGLSALTLVQLIALAQTDLSTLPLTPEQRAQVAQQLAEIAAQPAWAGLAGVWERVWAMMFHVAMSVLVLQVFRRGSLRWLWLAIGAHALLDWVVAALPLLVPLSGSARLLVSEGLVMLAGLCGLWLIMRLRDQPAATPSTPDAGV